MDAIDSVYVLVGYKVDKDSLKQVQDHLDKTRARAREIVGDLKEAAAAYKSFATFARQSSQVRIKAEDQAARAAEREAKEAAKREAAHERMVQKLIRDKERADKAQQRLDDRAAKAADKEARDAAKRAKQASDEVERSAKIAKVAWATILGAGVLGAGALAKRALTATARRDTELNDLATASNTQVEAFSSLAYVARLAGVPVDNLRDGLNDLSEKSNEAFKALQEGKDNEYLKTFKELGIDVANFVKLSPDQRFSQFADALNGVQDAGKRSMIVMKLMSDEGTKFNAIFNLGTAQIEAYRKEAREIGAVLGPKAASELGRYSLAMARLQTRFETITDTFSRAVTPVITDAMEELIKGITVEDIKRMANDSKAFAATLRNDLIPALRALISMGKSIGDMIRDLGGLRNVIALITIALVTNKIAVAASTGAWKGWAASTLAASKSAALLAGKMVLLAAPLLLLEDYASWKGGEDSVFGAIFGPRSQDNLVKSEALLMQVAGALTFIIGLVFGVPAAIGVAVATLAYLVYDELDNFKAQWRMIADDFGLYFMTWIDVIAEALTGLMPEWAKDLFNAPGVSAPTSIWGAGGAVEAITGNTSNVSTRNSTYNAQVVVNAPGAQDPQAVGTAAEQGVAEAARKMHAVYNDGVR